MSEKQTPVEFLKAHVPPLGYYRKIVNKALEMEREQIADLQSRLDLAVKALDELMNSIPENRPLYKDSGLWQLRSDDMEDVLFQQEVNECFIDFVKRITKLKGGADDSQRV